MKRHHTAAVAALACTALTLAACGQGDVTSSSLESCVTDPVGCNAGERAEGGEITWALDGSWGSWNQNTAEGNNAYVSVALVGMWPYTGQFDPNGDYIVNEGLFASEPELVSEDPVTVEYDLKSGANWGDGTEITADDFIYHWYATSGDAALCEGCDPANITRGSQVASITGDGSKVTVVYKDTYHSAEWQYEEVLSEPAHVAEEQGFDWKNDPADMKAAEDYFATTVPTWTTGPFKIQDAKPGEYVIYVPNEDWAGDTEVTLDKITFEVVDGLDNIVTALRNGEIDGASPFSVTSEAITQLESAENLSYSVAAGPSWEHIDLNTRNEFLSDPALRQAVFTAIDVENIISRTYAYVQSDIERKGNHLFRNGSDYYKDFLSATGQGLGDIELAHGLLEEAGYTWDADGLLLSPEGDQVELNFRYSESKENRKVTGELTPGDARRPRHPRRFEGHPRRRPRHGPRRGRLRHHQLRLELRPALRRRRVPVLGERLRLELRRPRGPGTRRAHRRSQRHPRLRPGRRARQRGGQAGHRGRLCAADRGHTGRGDGLR